MKDADKSRKRSNPIQKQNPLKKREVRIGFFLIAIVVIILLLFVFSLNDQTDNGAAPADNPVAVIDTTMGTITVELYVDEMPITTDNFITLVNDGFYTGLVFHRVINNFMVQGGGFYPNGTQKQSPYGPIQLETNPNVLHIDGAISMARLSTPVDSATNQFFICDGPQAFLDGQYAAFGKVIDGMSVVRNIAALDPAQTTTKYGMQNWPVNDVLINSITIEYL